MEERVLFVKRSSLEASISTFCDVVPLYSQHNVGFDLGEEPENSVGRYALESVSRELVLTQHPHVDLSQ